MRSVNVGSNGSTRSLDGVRLGVNSPACYAVPHEDAAMIPGVKRLAPEILRFPGGTVANFWDWRAGQLSVPKVTEGASRYREFLMSVEPHTRAAHPNGISVERFAEIASEVGAEVVLVVNLESDTVQSQQEWFAHMHSLGIVPRRIEMGNEFYLALLGDRESRLRFPDWATTAKITREYVDAIRPFLPADAVVAVQSAGSRFWSREDQGAGEFHHWWTWDDDMSPELWFDAVTVHPYAEIDLVAGPGSAAGLPGNVDAVTDALMARADEGLRRALDAIVGALPGKQIWMTEWGPGVVAQLGQPNPPSYDGMWLHVTARYLLTMLAYPAVTVSAYHSLFHDGGIYALFRPNSEGGYTPMGAAELHRWFHVAARQSDTFETLSVDGSKAVVGGGSIADETYLDIAAGLFRGDSGTTLFAQNASREPVRIDVGAISADAPDLAETMATADLAASLADAVPPVRPLPTARAIEVPPRSITRFVWES